MVKGDKELRSWEEFVGTGPCINFPTGLGTTRRIKIRLAAIYKLTFLEDLKHEIFRDWYSDERHFASGNFLFVVWYTNGA